MEIKIQKLTEQEEWEDFQTVDFEDESSWSKAAKIVYELNTNSDNLKYRAMFVNGFLTHFYSDGFCTMPTYQPKLS